jgi:hypothetical protein
MPENVVINIEANTSGLQQTIDLMVKMGVVTEDTARKFKAVNDQTMAGLNKAASDTKKSFEEVSRAVDNIKKDNGLAKALDVSKEALNVGNSFNSLRAQLKAATLETQQLADKFGELDPRTLAAAKRAGELKDKIGDINAQIAALTPEGKFNAIKNLAGAIGGVFQVATGALQAFGVESERATKIAQQFQGALNIFGGLSQLAQVKDAMVALRGVIGATTAAKEADIVVTEAAAAANTAFSASLSPLGIGLIVAALGGIVYAMTQIGDSTENTKNKTIGLTEATKQLVDEQKKLKELKKGELDADLELQVVTGEKTKENARRIQLQRDSAEKQAEVQERINKTLDNQNKLQKKISDDQQALNEISKQSFQGSGEARKAIEERIAANQKELTVTTKLYQTQAAEKASIDKQYTTQFQASKIGEAKAAEEAEKAKQDAAKKTAQTQQEKPKTNTELYKQEYDRLLSLQKQYFDGVKLEALKSGKSQEDIAKDLEQVEIDRLTQQIDAAKATYQDYTALEVQLQELINKRKGLPPIKAQVSEDVSQIPDYVKDIIAQLDNLNEQVTESLIQSAGQIVTSYFGQYLEGIQNATEMQREELDKQEQDLQESYDKRLIGRMELEAKEQDLMVQKNALERKLKADQAKADRQKALFDVAINTASALVRLWVDPGFPQAAPLVPYIVGLGAIQAGTIMAQPLPKYKKGTLMVPGIGNEDTHPALLTPGEAVIPKDTNAKYREAIGAIYHGKISPQDLNSFVRMKLKGDYSSERSSSTSGGTMKMDTSDLYALGKIIRRNDGVVIKNVGELASIIASMHNPRR